MAFAPDREVFNSYQSTLKRPKSANFALSSPPVSTSRKNIYGAVRKTPSAAEVAYKVLKKIHRAAGEESRDIGRSVYDNLNYLQTEPTLKLLQQKTWRQFFSEHVQGEDLDFDLTGTATSRSPQAPRPEHSTQADNQINYPKLFKKLVKRTLSLWKELHVPDCDRDFYSYSLLQGPYKTTEQIDELACYVRRLKDHRRSTIAVLRFIEHRESCVIQCTELIASARRSSSMKFMSASEEVARKVSAGQGTDRHKEMAEELRKSLHNLRDATVDVVKAIQLWRKEMWRPHPFVYMNQNYLRKVATDMDLLKSDSIERILDSLGIESSDLVGVVFHSSAETGATYGSQHLLSFSQQLSSHAQGMGTEPPQGSKTVSRPPQGVEDTPREPLRVGGVEGSAVFGEESRVSDIEAMIAVVNEEETLQRALLLERKALLSRGAFIPLLKFEVNEQSKSVPNTTVTL